MIISLKYFKCYSYTIITTKKTFIILILFLNKTCDKGKRYYENGNLKYVYI